MIYFLSPCAYTTAKWLGDKVSLQAEVAAILSTATHMQCMDRIEKLPPPTPHMQIFWWQWAMKSQYNVEWLISLYECMIELENKAHFRRLSAYAIVNPVRACIDAFPTEDFTLPLNCDLERKRYVSDVIGTRRYAQVVPPFWILNRQKVVGFKEADEESDEFALDDD